MRDGGPVLVLYFSNTLARGGAEEHLLTLLRGLDPARFRAALACTPELAIALGPDLPAEVEVLRVRLRRPGDWQGALRLCHWMRARRPSVVHSHLFHASLFASPLARLCGVPAIVETPHVSERWRQAGWKSSYTVDRWAGRTVDYYIAVSAANARYLAEEKKLPARKIVVIHNGCDLERFDPARVAPEDTDPWGIGPTDRLLVVAARLEPQKGHAVLMEAVARVAPHFPRLKVACLGEGRLKMALRAMAKRLGLAGVIRFPGYQPVVERWLARAEAAVLPSHYEGLPLAVIEALAMARPVVATAVDGTPEVVRDGLHGRIVPPGDAAALAAAIAEVLRDPERARGWGAAGRTWVQERFSHRQQLEKTQALYLQAAARRQAPRAAPLPLIRADAAQPIFSERTRGSHPEPPHCGSGTAGSRRPGLDGGLGAHAGDPGIECVPRGGRA